MLLLPSMRFRKQVFNGRNFDEKEIYLSISVRGNLINESHYSRHGRVGPTGAGGSYNDKNH
jgi:hypothetical protein